VMHVPAVGNYWMPLGAVSYLSLVSSLLSHYSKKTRLAAALVGFSGAYLVASDISAGKRHLRKPFRWRKTHNVLGWHGNEKAEQTVVIVAHHDSAPSGAIFSPKIPDLAWQIAPKLMSKNESGPPVMVPVVCAPALVGLGALLKFSPLLATGALASALMSLVFTDVALRKTVPGANDNASGVACLLELARRLSDKPVEKTRVLLLSTGAEEALLEGMEGFAKQYFPDLDREKTFFITVDSVGSEQLCLLKGEGMLKMHQYPKQAMQRVKAQAKKLGLALLSDLSHRNSTDGLYPLKAGYQTVMLGSVNERNLPDNYHWRTDIEENINYKTVKQAVDLCEATLRDIDQCGISHDCGSAV
jgi:hypothetical protein